MISVVAGELPACDRGVQRAIRGGVVGVVVITIDGQLIVVAGRITGHHPIAVGVVRLLLISLAWVVSLNVLMGVAGSASNCVRV